jgi:hypothetical protein
MKERRLPKTRFSSWIDLTTLGLMSLVSPWAAAIIHSTYVFSTGIRFYNAELWRLADHHAVLDVLVWLGWFGIPSIITFLILLPFRNYRQLQWILWGCSVLIWLGLFFQMETAIR